MAGEGRSDRGLDGQRSPLLEETSLGCGARGLGGAAHDGADCAHHNACRSERRRHGAFSFGCRRRAACRACEAAPLRDRGLEAPPNKEGPFAACPAAQAATGRAPSRGAGCARLGAGAACRIGGLRLVLPQPALRGFELWPTHCVPGLRGTLSAGDDASHLPAVGCEAACQVELGGARASAEMEAAPAPGSPPAARRGGRSARPLGAVRIRSPSAERPAACRPWPPWRP